MAGCSICISAPARALADGAIMAGLSPKQAWEYHLKDMSISLSATYRHCTNHKPDNELTVSFLGDEMSGDIIADLVTLKRSHVQQRDRAIERNDHATAAREGASALSASTTLLKSGITDDEAGMAAQSADRLTRALQRATKNDPAIADALAVAARELYFADLAQDADDLARVVREYQSNREKMK